MKTLHIALAAAATLAAILSSGCSEDSENGYLSNVYVVVYSGNYQHERPGAPLADPLVVRVRDALNNSKDGVTVVFSTDVSDAVVNPATAATDEDGLASCSFQLGSGEGTQHVYAAIEGDTARFTIYADAIACDEETPQLLRRWDAGHIFIATTGSSLISGSGSVIIDYDPASRTITKVLETDDLIEGISFSPHGELFVSSPYKIRKVNETTPALDEYITHSTALDLALDPNPGGVLAGLWANGPVMINCPPSEISLIVPPASFPGIQWECIAIDPVTRDFHLISKNSSTSYTLWRLAWDGRSDAEQEALASLLLSESADARGMCVDSSGAAYIVFDSNDDYRRIVRVGADGAINYSFFDFWAHYGNAQEAGRWGDIAYLGGKLYVIDKRNDRLVTISGEGVWLDEHEATEFSRPLDESEHYMIAPSP